MGITESPSVCDLALVREGKFGFGSANPSRSPRERARVELAFNPVGEARPRSWFQPPLSDRSSIHGTIMAACTASRAMR